MGRRDAAGKESGRFERIGLVSEGQRNIGRKEGATKDAIDLRAHPFFVWNFTSTH